jgi:hypothetical protein
MENLEKIIINSNNKIYVDDINYKKLGYDDYDDFEIDLFFLVDSLYPNCKLIFNKYDKKKAVKHIKKYYSKSSPTDKIIDGLLEFSRNKDNKLNDSYIIFIAKIGYKMLKKEIDRRENRLDYHIY